MKGAGKGRASTVDWVELGWSSVLACKPSGFGYQPGKSFTSFCGSLVTIHQPYPRHCRLSTDIQTATLPSMSIHFSLHATWELNQPANSRVPGHSLLKSVLVTALALALPGTNPKLSVIREDRDSNGPCSRALSLPHESLLQPQETPSQNW